MQSNRTLHANVYRLFGGQNGVHELQNLATRLVDSVLTIEKPVKACRGFGECVLAAAKLVGDLWRFIDSVLTYAKPVGSL